MTGRLGRRIDRAGRRSSVRRIALIGGSETTEIDNSGLSEKAVPPAPRPRGTRTEGNRSAALPDHYGPDTLLAFARETYNIRRRRARSLPSDLFGEPTWDILLDLYVATRENRPVPTTSACIGAHVPPTTALRWLRILETRGLVDREEDGRDGRRTFVRLSDQGLAAMDEWMRAALAALEPVVVGGSNGTGPLAEAAE